jgi:23S rRNA (uracil1939-C5)-methyltransferase
MNNNYKKQQDKTAQIHALSHDGRGIATIENKTTFIAGALPGETVSYQIMNRRGSFDEATCTKVEGHSPDRATPPCQHFGVCGGCSLQHINISAQTRIKQEALLDQLRRLGNVIPESVLEPLNAESTGYRRKARMGAKFVHKKGKMLIGFREKKSRYLADLESCMVLHPRIGMQFEAIKTVIGSLSIFEQIPQVEVAIGDADVSLIFRHMAPLNEDDKNKLIAFGKNQQIDIYLQPNPPEQIKKLWPENTPHRLRYSLPEFNVTFLFHPTDFTQINLEINRQMVKQAIDLLDPQANENILDLYCGIGNFTLPISRRAHTVTGVEGSDEMVKRAYENA